MMINGRNEILELLRMPDEQFGKAIIPQAKQTAEQTLGRTLRVTSMMGYTNICKNNCLYCGMRAGNPALPRYRTPPGTGKSAAPRKGAPAAARRPPRPPSKARR